MALLLPQIRIIVYVALWLFALVLLGLAGARLHYTTHLPSNDPLNHGTPFFDPIVAELVVCALLALIWAPLVIHTIHGRYEHRYAPRVWHEIVGLSILWILWLVGAAVATSIWPNLPSFCSQFMACRVLTAMLAFAWLGWISISCLLVVSFMYAITNTSWTEPAHGYWTREDNLRGSMYSTTYPVSVNATRA